MALPTTKQKMAFGELLRKIETREPFDLKNIMINAGYTEATAKNPEKNLTSKTGWQQLLAQIDDQVILAKIYEILLGDDKRSSLTAADMVLKLKDKFPQRDSKLAGMFGVFNK